MDGRVAVVTGGASGIGLGIVRHFLALGYRVAMLDADAEAVAREGEALGRDADRLVALTADVSRRDQIEAAYAAVRERFGPITVVIANAGLSGPAPFATMTAETWQRMVDVNLTGVFHTIQAALPDMLAARWGRIVTISSQAAQSGAQDRAHYAAAKGGVMGLTRSLAREFGADGITVNTIPPSLVDTPMARAGEARGEVPPLEELARMIPVPRPGTPDDIAAACAYLCSDGASYVTGATLNVNGGSWM